MKQYDTIVVGGGAAGLIAAGVAAQSGQETLLVERNARCARKILVTGKGRCNVTNHTQLPEILEHIPVNGRFLYSAFSAFSPQQTMELLEGEGVPLKVERGNRVFPVSDRAMDVADALVSFAQSQGAKRIQGRAVSLLLEEDAVTGVELESGERLTAGRVVVATGGLSYPATGSTGDGYRLAEQAGHTIIPTRPSLVPLVAHDGFCSHLQGLALRNVAISVYDKQQDKELYRDFGELLFTHFGLSGPVILSASAHMRQMEKGRFEIIIDCKPALSEEQLDNRLLRDFGESSNQALINALRQLLPKTLIPVVIARAGLQPACKVNQITREERQRLGRLLKYFPVTIDGFRPMEEAVVTSGGVDVRQVNPKTMESKLKKRLYFAGEVLDVDGYTGGFNLQIAFSTGYVAGRAGGV